MFLKRIVLKNFRSYSDITLDFDNLVTLITGSNGTGKTNLLEAIYILSNIRSFRMCSDRDLIYWGMDYYFCKGVTENGSVIHEFSAGFQSSLLGKNKKLMINGNEIQRAADYYGKLITVIFHPGDLQLVTGPPEIRRKYFDSVISKFDNHYMSVLMDYKHILVSRNALLKDIREQLHSVHDLDVWDDMLVEKAAILMEKRIDFMKKYNNEYSLAYGKLAGNREMSEIAYNYNENFLKKDKGLAAIRDSRKKDIMIGSTSLGPHRDTYSILGFNEKIFTSSASQGQMRSAAIALKKAEKEIIESYGSIKPILLIDDIFSEIDAERTENFISLLGTANQLFITMVAVKNWHNFSSPGHFMVDCNGMVSKI